MDKITVAELAAECSVQNQAILAELKKLGLYVFSPAATIDANFAETIRKKIFSAREAAEAKVADEERKAHLRKEKEAEAARRAEKKAAKKPASPAEEMPAVETASPAPTPAPAAAAATATAARKARKAPVKPAAVSEKKAEEHKAEEEPHKPSLAPRKGRKHFDRESAELMEAAPTSVPKLAELTPSEIAQKLTGEVPRPVEEVPVPEPEPVPAPQAAVAPPEPEPVVAAAPAPEPEPAPPAPAETAAQQPAAIKKIILPKAKTKILMRTSAEKVAAPDITDKLLKTIQEKPAIGRPSSQMRLVRKKKPGGRPEPVERIARVVELPRVPESPEDYRPISITEGVTLKELAEKMDIKSKYIIQKLISRGILASINQALDVEIATQICAEFGFRAEMITFEQEAEAKQEVADNVADYATRPPVVTIMGHVDHGKTSLLDAIRQTNVTATEHGGITQHIGAYQVDIKGRSITFLDTPGHEAFTLMRARGAQATDVVVLVVAADDGVMPQTIEAIHHAKAANVPILVAINKIDKPGSQLDRVKQTLADQGLLAEDWGGDVVMVPVSAKMKTNIDLLLEMILLVADMKELKANPRRLAAGVVLEAKVDKGRGCVATVLVQNGTLNVSDSFVAGNVHGRVRALVNYHGTVISHAGPSVPVEIQGLQDLPRAGDTFQVFEDASKARQVAEYRQAKVREKSLRTSARFSLQALFEQLREGKVKELPVILKADVQGSVEVLSDVLNKLSTDKVKVRILHSGAGAVTETDVLLASASDAIVIGFNVRPERKAQDLADAEGVEIRLYTVIYNVSNDIKNAMIGILDVTSHEKYLGRAEVRDTFKVPKYGFIAGSYIIDGLIKRNAEVRLLRDNVVIHEGKIGSLRRFKDDVSEVKSGFECGIGIDNFGDVKVGDIIEAYIIEKVQPTTL
jgi:translation initiation factor IF-2